VGWSGYTAMLDCCAGMAHCKQSLDGFLSLKQPSPPAVTPPVPNKSAHSPFPPSFLSIGSVENTESIQVSRMGWRGANGFTWLKPLQDRFPRPACPLNLTCRSYRCALVLC